MDKIASARDIERKGIFAEVADIMNINDFMVEKDFWVSWILGKIFADKELSQILCFKGGTSLSKAFSLIDRFSEDIDIILSQSIVLKEGESLIRSSNTKQAAFNKTIEERAINYIKTNLKDKIERLLEPLCSVYLDKIDGHVIFIKFPYVFNYSYIQPEIKMEIGPLALWDPNERYPISSFVSKALIQLKLELPSIPTVRPERTFWEKITILHHEHYRPESSLLPSRYSRHYYDVFKMSNSDVKESALVEDKLLKEVVSFKKRFYPRAWERYDEAFPGSIRLLPAKHNSMGLEEDYLKMQKMIFGDKPDWKIILAGLQMLENEINNR